MTKKNICVKIILAAIVLALIAVGIFLGMRADKQEPEGDICVKTPYCEVVYPGKWKDRVETRIQDGDNYVVTFCMRDTDRKEHPVFSLSFVDGSGTYVGSVLTEEQETVDVFLETFDVAETADWEQSEKEIFYAMRDDINVTLEHLPLVMAEVPVEEETGAVEVESTEPVHYEDYVVETPYANLYYPGQWAQNLNVVQMPSAVVFYGIIDEHPAAELFSFSFLNGAAGNLGTLEGTYVGVSFAVADFVPDQTWSDEQIGTFYAMQEAVNYVLERLAVVHLPISGNTPEQEQIHVEKEENEDAHGDLVTHTPYCDLYFPGTWANKVRVECLEGADYRVEYYGRARWDMEVLLFTVCFGGQEGNFLGTILTPENQTVNVSIIINEDLGYAGQTAEELAVLLGIQEDLNYVISLLPLSEMAW